MDYPTSDAGARLHNGKFTDGDPVNNIPPSKDSATYQNMVFDELIGIITAAGHEPNENKTTQLKEAIDTLIAASSGLKESDLADLAVFSHTLSTIGEQTLPGGLIIKFGSFAFNTKRIVFPLAFPTKCIAVYPTGGTSHSNLDAHSSYRTDTNTFNFGSPTPSGVDIQVHRNNSSNGRYYRYLAIGY